MRSREKTEGMSQGSKTPGSSRRTRRDWDNATEKPSFVEARSRKLKLLAELCAASEDGKAVHPEDLLPRWPTDPATDPDVASLLFEDFRQRQRRGEKPSVEEYDGRFPEHKDSVASLFHYHDFMRSVTGASDCSGPPLALPSVGDELFGFRLRQELGSGAFGRVFLAEQANLAGRLVVLKTSDTNGDEPQTLAQLQHTHTCPISAGPVFLESYKCCGARVPLPRAGNNLFKLWPRSALREFPDKETRQGAKETKRQHRPPVVRPRRQKPKIRFGR